MRFNSGFKGLKQWSGDSPVQSSVEET